MMESSTEGTQKMGKGRKTRTIKMKNRKSQAKKKARIKARTKKK